MPATPTTVIGEASWYVIVYGSVGTTVLNYQYMQNTAAAVNARAAAIVATGVTPVNITGPFPSQAAAQAAVGQTVTAPPTPNPTAGKGGGSSGSPAQTVVPTLVQPPFDPRIRTVHNPLSTAGAQAGGAWQDTNIAQFDRGFMVWDTSLTATAGYSPTNPPYVRFLFNPSTIQASYSISNSSSANSTMIFGVPPAGGGGAQFVQLQQSMSFTIMFDRTYELNSSNYAPDAAGSDVATMGCEVDVRQVKQFAGMFSNSNNPTSGGFYTSSGGAAGAGAGSAAAAAATQSIAQATGIGPGPQQGLMLMMPSYVYFGSSLLGGTSQYYGYMDTFDVQYTHYTAFMIPIRCVVDISFTLLPITSGNALEGVDGAVAALAHSQNQAPTISGGPLPLP